MFRQSLLSLVVPLTLAATAARAHDPIGEWLNETGEVRVRVDYCGAAICGTISWVRDDREDASQPLVDRKNEDPALRARPILGLPVILDMAPNGQDSWRGRVYNAIDGHIYAATARILDPNTARIEGCVLYILCKAQNWARQTAGAAPTRPPRGSAAR